jgi:hypothetical protein
MAFSGKALYDTNVFDNELAEDVAPIVSMISPSETPLLDYIGDPQYPAQNILHEWTEDELNPNTFVASTALASAASGTGAIGVQYGNQVMVGAILASDSTAEYFQVTAVSADTITVSRAFGGTTASSVTIGTQLSIISDSALEGADVSVDISRVRSRLSNYLQIFKKDVIISGSTQATKKLGGITSELDYQVRNRSREAIRDLEKATIRGILSGNTIGTSSAYRTMRGLWSAVSTNAQSVATLTESWLGNSIKSAWNNGARDLDVIVVDANYKRIIDSWNSTRIRTNPEDATYRNLVTEYEGTFGTQRIILSRWMPANSGLILASSRIQVMPLAGRSFAYVPIAPTGDASKGMVIGEYTVEYKNENGLARIYNG